LTDGVGGLGRPGIQAGRDALVAGRDLRVNYFIYNGTWTDGVAPQPLVGGSGEITAPYRGLGAFGERDEKLFFGRECAVSEVLRLLSERTAGPGLLVVSGVSGAGKSSLLRAGVLPRLRREGLAAAPSAAEWPCLVLNPGGSPLDELAAGVGTMLRVPASSLRKELAAAPASFGAAARQAALAGVDRGWVDADPENAAHPRRLLVVVDQCEKLFTQCTAADSYAFLSALCAASAPGSGKAQVPAAMTILVIRADFEARLADYAPQVFPEIGQAVQDRYLLRGMNELELQMAITGPAARVGSGVEENLVRLLLSESRTGPAPGDSAGAAIGAGALPLLSHALEQAWRARAGPDLTLADYERTGGIRKAVAVTAQAAFEELSAAQQEAARRVFTRLVAAVATAPIPRPGCRPPTCPRA
jgi:hypothetical protein